MKPHINKKIEEALGSLDGIQRAEPQPYFYTRLLGRLQREESRWERIGSVLSRPAVVITGLFVVLFMNVLILLNQENVNTNTVPVASESSFITDNEYLIASGSSFDYENIDTP